MTNEMIKEAQPEENQDEDNHRRGKLFEVQEISEVMFR